jgi:hypothetical protein
MCTDYPRPEWDALRARLDAASALLDSDRYPYLARMLCVTEDWVRDQKSETVTREFLESLENSGLEKHELGSLLLWKKCEAPDCPMLLNAPWLCPWCSLVPDREPHPCCWRVYRKRVSKKKHAMRLRSQGPGYTSWIPVFS